MCLYTKQICPLRARKDIVCYKKFHVWNFFLKTYYKLQKITKPKENHPTLMDDTNTPLVIYKLHDLSDVVRYQIFGGMIHAYKTKPEYICTNAFTYPRIGWYKCIIPKGTLYYVGTNNDICAKQMLVVERVDSNTAE